MAAKVSFLKITPIKSIDHKIVEINGEKVTIIQYLPIGEKAELVGEVLEDTLDEHGMNSIIREKLYTDLHIIQHYTNINITETMLDNASKTYDALTLNNVIKQVIENIPEDEYKNIITAIHDSIKIVSDFRTSFGGMFVEMTGDNQATTKSADEMLEQLNEISKDGLMGKILENLG